MVTSITSNVRIRRSLFPAPSCKSVVVLSKTEISKVSLFTFIYYTELIIIHYIYLSSY